MTNAFRRFCITAKVRECATITSFYLTPADGQPMWPASPGQYVTLRLPIGDESVLKTYSISTDVNNKKQTRISVKREAAPAHLPNVQDGIGSCWLHDQAQIGTEIDIAAPRGNFIINENSTKPVVLLSGGVGLTPLLSMLHHLTNTQRQVWFVHGCENGEQHALHKEVKNLVENSNDRMQTHTVYRTPLANDPMEQPNFSTGLIDKTLLQSLLPLDDYEWYLCGPTAFMVAQYKLLRSLGVTEDSIAYEFFGKSLSLPELATEPSNNETITGIPPTAILDTKPPIKIAASNAPAALANLAHLTNPAAWSIEDSSPSSGIDASGTTVGVKKSAVSQPEIEVVFAKSAISTTWSDSSNSLLELAERAGLEPAFSCRSGICNTCMCSIKEGDVEYFEEPLQPPEPGKVLICCSRPKGRVVLDL